jgi:hypothetical protein
LVGRIKAGLTEAYRSKVKEAQRVERRHMQTPLRETEVEVARLHGVAEGFVRSLAIVEDASDMGLPMIGGVE